jgi:uncharacterized protein
VTAPYLSPESGGVLVSVRVQPRAARAGIAGERQGRLLLRVGEPPADGAANAAACRLLARAAGVAAGQVTVVRGHRSREKLLQVRGVTVEALTEALADRPAR